MSSVNSVRIPGLATGMDTDQMVKEMLTGEQNKVDKAKQKEQITKWQQESYRDIIKNVKGLYDKYFSATSPDYILSSKVFSTTTVNSSNSSVISATAGAGTGNINYKFKVEQMAQPPRIESKKIDKNQTLREQGLIIGETSTIEINGQAIELNSTDKIADVAKKINDKFPNGEVKAKYSEMTGTFKIEGAKTGISSQLSFGGQLLIDMGMTLSEPGSVLGSNNKVIVYASDGITELKAINEENNSFTIDNITYTVNGVSNELVSMTSQKDTKSTVDKIKSFVEDYNKVIDEIYDSVTQKKNRNYSPLTEVQREEMKEEEIEKWEKKAKEGILRNDKELRSFMENIKSEIIAPVDGLGINLSDIGISSDQDYNKQGQLHLDVDKFTKALEEKGDLVYKATTTAFGRLKDVTYKYVGSSGGVFVKKAGMEKSSTEINNLFSNQIKKQEEQIKSLTRKMKDKEESLYKKFARLESNMNKLNSQMSYLTSSMGM
jgi:flagellar hook-associated protein 2